MAPQAGSRFGPYEIIALLGAGAMGEVYRARDSRLKREVAIKVLARAGGDPERQRRLLDEAQAASALSHPNVVAVYDVGSTDGVPFVVSELVEGTSLRALASRAPVAIRDLLDLAVQMADGLAAAHQARITHRDFKPENVMVTRDGRVKILDFGLALVGGGGLTDGDTIPTRTVSTSIVGTVPYMSPEQARGGDVDYRTDQFSLGLTLYELATGRRAFRAETAAQVLAAIIEDDPEPIANVNPKVPLPMRWAIERCLAKDPRQRYDSTADLARELRTVRDRLAELTPIAGVEPVDRPTARLLPLVMASAVAAGVIAVAAQIWVGTASGPNLATYRMTPLATDAGYQSAPAWSPDGKTLAYVADVDGVLQVFTRALASSLRAQLTHARFDCNDPFWSPDGTRVYYRSLARDRDGLWSISAAGGEAEVVLEDVNHAALSPDGRSLAFFRSAKDVDVVVGAAQLNGQLWISSPPGSPPVPYTRPPFGERRHGYYSSSTLRFSPDGSKLGAWVVPADVNKSEGEFWVLPMGTGAPHLMPAPAPAPGFIAAFSWFPDSRRIISALPYPRPGVHLWVSDTERHDPRLITMSGEFEGDPSLSQDGSKLALTLQNIDYDLYQLSAEHRSPTILLATSRNEMDPAWSPVAPEMAFTTDRSGHEEIWLRSQQGDWERPLVTPRDFGGGQTFYVNTPAFSPDGQRIAFTRLGSTDTRIWISPVAGGPPVQLAAGDLNQDAPSWSPDGAWIAYAQTQQMSLAKKRVGAQTPPEVLANHVADWRNVQWAPDGAWIAFNGREGLSVVSSDGKSERILHEQPWFGFAWSADSQRVYGIRRSDDFKHLTFASVDVRSSSERILSADFMPMPVSGQPVRGFTRASGTTFLTSIARVRSDVWMLEGFDPAPSAWSRLGGLWPFRRSP